MATAADLGTACRGAVLISPMRVATYSVRHRLPVFVVYGERDRVINQQDIRNVTEVWFGMLFDGVREVYPDEDHFLMFSARGRLLADVEAWMKKVSGPGR